MTGEGMQFPEPVTSPLTTTTLTPQVGKHPGADVTGSFVSKHFREKLQLLPGTPTPDGSAR